jgi:hypothetical protein
MILRRKLGKVFKRIKGALTGLNLVKNYYGLPGHYHVVYRRFQKTDKPPGRNIFRKIVGNRNICFKVYIPSVDKVINGLQRVFWARAALYGFAMGMAMPSAVCLALPPKYPQ